MARKKSSPKQQDEIQPVVQSTAKAHRASIVKLVQQAAGRSDYRRVFSDFIEMAALSISNVVDRPQFELRENRYLEIVKSYKPEEIALFPRMLAELTQALEAEPHDALGMIYGELEIMNKHTGQFFTPYELCRLMAKMMIDDSFREKIDQNGHITVQEPACGAGANIIALAHEMKDANINYQQTLHVTATDVDLRCVHMCYLQCSLLHIPAVVFHGNTLSQEMFSQWNTPAHIMGGWYRKQNKLIMPVESPVEILVNQ